MNIGIGEAFLRRLLVDNIKRKGIAEIGLVGAFENAEDHTVGIARARGKADFPNHIGLAQVEAHPCVAAAL